MSINGAGIMGSQPIRAGASGLNISPTKQTRGPVRPVHGIGSEEAFGDNPMPFESGTITAMNASHTSFKVSIPSAGFCPVVEETKKE